MRIHSAMIPLILFVDIYKYLFLKNKRSKYKNNFGGPYGGLLHQIDYRVLKSTKCNQKFQQQASDNLKVHSMASLDKASFGHSKQTFYEARFKEVSSIRNALKHWKEQDLSGVDLNNLIVTCAKQNWYRCYGRRYNKAKPSVFNL